MSSKLIHNTKGINLHIYFLLFCIIFPISLFGQTLRSVSISNNYYSSTTYGVFQIANDQFLCNLFGSEFYNTAFHTGASNEPIVGDYMVYNRVYPTGSGFLEEDQGYALVKLQFYNKVIEVSKSTGQIVAEYNCSNNTVVTIPPPLIYFENGICKCPTATIGVTETIGGITYTVVDNT